MAKYYGIIGFAVFKETKPGVYQDEIAERDYCGDFLRNIKNYQNSGNANDNLTISSQISIIADEYAYSYYSNIRYITINGTKWKVTSIDIQFPRFIISVGGLYNG